MNAPERLFERPQDLSVCPYKFADFVAQSIEVRTTEDLISLFKNGLQPIFPYGMMLGGIGHAERDRILVYQAVGINYPKEYLEKLRVRPILAGPVLAQWLQTREPQTFDLEQPAHQFSERWLNAIKRCDLRNIAAHGVRDVRGPGASYFTFSRIPSRVGSHHRRLLTMLVPHLHHAISKAAEQGHANVRIKSRHAIQLTQRERQILAFLTQGKNNRDIAAAIDRSIHTVNNHVKNILTKVGADNRTEAVTRSLELQLK